MKGKKAKSVGRGQGRGCEHAREQPVWLAFFPSGVVVAVVGHLGEKHCFCHCFVTQKRNLQHYYHASLSSTRNFMLRIARL